MLEFMKEGAAAKYFDSIPSGLSFLRGAVGNFPSHLQQLMAAANYVRLTQVTLGATATMCNCNNV